MERKENTKRQSTVLWEHSQKSMTKQLICSFQKARASGTNAFQISIPSRMIKRTASQSSSLTQCLWRRYRIEMSRFSRSPNKSREKWKHILCKTIKALKNKAMKTINKICTSWIDLLEIETLSVQKVTGIRSLNSIKMDFEQIRGNSSNR